MANKFEDYMEEYRELDSPELMRHLVSVQRMINKQNRRRNQLLLRISNNLVFFFWLSIVLIGVALLVELLAPMEGGLY